MCKRNDRDLELNSWGLVKVTKALLPDKSRHEDTGKGPHKISALSISKNRGSSTLFTSDFPLKVESFKRLGLGCKLKSSFWSTSTTKGLGSIVTEDTKSDVVGFGDVAVDKFKPFLAPVVVDGVGVAVEVEVVVLVVVVGSFSDKMEVEVSGAAGGCCFPILPMFCLRSVTWIFGSVLYMFMRRVNLTSI